MDSSKYLIYRNFDIVRSRPSDINEHLQTLYDYATQCSAILECGVRSVVSTWAFAAGLLDNGQDHKTLIGVDSQPVPNFHLVVKSSDRGVNTIQDVLGHELNFGFFQGNDLNFPEGHWPIPTIHPPTFDLIFIDTWHVYGHMKRELAKFGPFCNKWLILHDTTVDAEVGESVRCNFDIIAQATESGYPVDEIVRGIWPAVEEFLETHPDFTLKHRYTNNNGLTVLERVFG